MIDFVVKGAIFDVDDTLLDNKPGVPGQGLHERSRLAAVHEVGKRHNITELQSVTVEENLNAFLDAPVHTIEAAVWGILLQKGLADSDMINLEDPLLREIVQLKDELHKDTLLKEGEEVPGATDFVTRLSKKVHKHNMGIASSAIRRDVNLFLKKTGMESIFSQEKITTIENITHPKPNPEAFDKAFESLGLPESDRINVCAFEDDPRGIMSARAAGLYVCAITTRYGKEELLALEFPPHLVANSYAEFCELFHLNDGN